MSKPKLRRIDTPTTKGVKDSLKWASEQGFDKIAIFGWQGDICYWQTSRCSRTETVGALANLQYQLLKDQNE